MKKILLILVIIIATITNSNAQKSYKKLSLEERSAKFTKEITDYVSNITPVQNAGLLEINKNVTIQFDSLKALQLESDEYKPAARNVFKTRDAAVKALLDPKQFDEFMMLQAEKRDAAFQKRKDQKEKDAKPNGEPNTEPKKYKKYFEKENKAPIMDSIKK